jgi:hypothetical protein
MPDDEGLEVQRVSQRSASGRVGRLASLRTNLRVAFGLDVWDVETARFKPVRGAL